MKTIPIFFSFDNSYVSQAAVTFQSLLTNTKPGVIYNLYVLYSNLSKDNQTKLKLIIKQHPQHNLTFINVSSLFSFTFDNKNFFTGDQNCTFTKETLYRCLPTLVKEFDNYDRIIYSDVDIVVVDDISDLLEINLTGLYLGAVRVPSFLNHQAKHLGQQFIGKYFGGGLWVMNLKKIRQDHLERKILDIITNPPCRLMWNDQDVMNLACNFKVKYISYQYVSIPCWYETLKKLDFIDQYYPNNELYTAMYSPKIIHYAAFKPWETSCRHGEIWYYWLAKTPFALNDQQTFRQRMKKKIFLFRKTCSLLLGLLPFLNKYFNYESTLRKINCKIEE